jgi:cytochrome P450/NADPH-cytochrome P450 reductase
MNAPLSLLDMPSPRGLPWLGNLLQIPRGRLTQHLLALSRDFDGILALDFAGLRLPFVYDPELVAELSDPRRFRKTIGPPLSTLRKLAADGLFTADGEEPNWGKAHRILMPAFGQRAMKGYFPYMLEVAEQLAAKWARQGPDADLEIADDMTRLTLDTISLAGFGYRFDSFARDELHPFLGAMGAVLEEVMTRITRSKLQNQLMRAGQERMELDIAAMHALVDEVIRARRANDAPRAQRDLLDLMLQARDPVTDEPLDDANIRAQVITFLIAGHETTSGLLTFALYQLMRHPETLARCYAEVDRVMPAGTTPAYEHIARLETLDRVLRETLRLWPTAPSYAVGAIDETLLGGRWRLPAGQRVIVFLPGLHRNPRWWERPEAFDIDRFAPGARERIHPHAYKPFGNGERACIGQQFAITEAKLALAVILQRFALSDPADYRLAVRETLTLKPDGLRLRATPRARPERTPVAPSPASPPPASPAPVAPPSFPEVNGRLARLQPPAVPGSPAPGALTRAEAAAAARQPFEIRYGSSVGVCAEVAEQVAEIARDAGFEPRVVALDDALPGWPATGWLVVVTATYNGRAPDNARRLEAALDDGSANAWRAPGLRVGVLGCGNSQWPAYQAFPRRVADALAASGATAFVARGQADGHGDFDGEVEGWLAALREALAPVAAARAASGAPVRAAGVSGDTASGPLRIMLGDGAPVRERALPPGASLMRVLDSIELTRPAQGLWDFAREAPRASTRMLRIALPEGSRFATGDHLAVWARNDPDRVAAIARRLGMNPETVILIEGDDAAARGLPRAEPMTVGRLLAECVEWQEPASRRDLERLLAATRCPVTRETLRRWLGDSAQDETARALHAREIVAARIGVADLLLAHPAIECSLADFLRCCTPMRPRWYSISSSARACPQELTITVGALDAPHAAGHGRYRGIASSDLCGARPGDMLVARVRTPAPAFAPPADPVVPIVMVGPGTGIAPFRGFLEERAWLRARGERVGAAWLFTGGRHPGHDDLHGEELAAWAAQGVLERSAAWSSLAGHPWRFVQDALWAQREALWAWLAQGAWFYLCGDGKAMAPAVRDTLRRIAGEALGDEARATAWLAELAATGRLREDVFN